MMWLVSMSTVWAQEQSASTRQSGGQVQHDAAITHYYCLGAPGAVSEMQAAGIRAQHGFLRSFLVNPNRDTDGDGVPDEIDPDNDQDGLEDEEELSGTAFNGLAVTDPNRSDTDGDGVGDAGEADAGTDPLDPDRYLRFTRIETPDGNLRLAWEARDGRRYRIYNLAAWPALHPRTLLASLEVAGGTPPWYVVTARTNLTGAATLDGPRMLFLEVDAP